jgi:hypothetical protein
MDFAKPWLAEGETSFRSEGYRVGSRLCGWIGSLCSVRWSKVSVERVAPRDFGSRPTVCATPEKVAICHLVPIYACSEIWVMQLGPLWRNGRGLLASSACGNWSSWDGSVNQRTGRQIVTPGTGSLGLGRRGKWRAELELCSVVRYLTAGGSTDCCRGVTYTQ